MKHFKITRRHALLLLLLVTAACVIWALGSGRQSAPEPENEIILNDDMTGKCRGILHKDGNECAFTLSFNYAKFDGTDDCYITDVKNCYLEKLKGWTVLLGNAKVLSDEISYRNDRQVADILVIYQATTGSNCADEFYTAVITLDLSAEGSTQGSL